MLAKYLESALLGALQGVTEFLPVSSDGHLALASLLFGVEDGGLTLNVLLHAGTLLATFLVLRKRALEALKEGLLALVKPARFTATPGGRDAAFVLCATAPTGVIGLLLRDAVEAWSVRPLAIGLGFVVTTMYLLVTRVAPDGEKEDPPLWVALVVGVVQGLAVAPGISRSGGTIAALLLFGVARSRAFELSMLMSLPAVLGAVVLELPHFAGSIHNLDAALFGTIVAFFVGVAALVTLRKVVVSGRFSWFALWTAPLAIATLAMARAWP